MTSHEDLPPVTDPLLAERFQPYRTDDRGIFMNALEQLMAYFTANAWMIPPTRLMMSVQLETIEQLEEFAAMAETKVYGKEQQRQIDMQLLNGPLNVTYYAYVPKGEETPR
jgi:hypothetical protein